MTVVPLLTDLVQGQENVEIAKMVSMPTLIGYSHWMSPSVPVDRHKALEQAYVAALTNPALLAEAKQLRIEIRPKSASQLRDLVGRAANATREVRARSTEILGWN